MTGATGIGTCIFKAHSIRGASTSAASNQAVTTKEILNAADWSMESSFQCFYYKPIHNTAFAESVLSTTVQTTPLTCETEPSDI